MTLTAWFYNLARRGLKKLPMVPDYVDWQPPEEFDLDHLVTTLGVIPQPGVSEMQDGSVQPRVYIKLYGSRDGEFVETTYSFDPYELAMVSNVLNTLAIGLVKYPDSVQAATDALTAKRADNDRGYL